MSKSGTILQDWQTYTWNRRKRTESYLYRGDEADDPETGDLFRTKARITGDGAYITEESFAIITDDIDAATVTQAHGAVGHGDAELAVASFRSPYPFMPAFEIEDQQHATWQMHLARYRQLLKNPSFDIDLGTAGNGWSWAGNVPPWSSTGGIDGGACIGDGGLSSWATWQSCYITGWESVEGLRTLFRCKVYSTDSDDTYRVRVLADGTTVISDTTAVAVAATSTWQIVELVGSIPSGTSFIDIELSAAAVGEFDNAASVRFDACELRIGNFSAELISNGGFNAGTTGWTAASGTWAVNAADAFEGAAGLRCASAGTAELYADFTPPTGYAERGTAHIRFAAKPTSQGEIDVILEARTAAEAVVASATWDATDFAGEGYRERDLFLDVDDATIDHFRVRLVQTLNLGVGSVNPCSMDAFTLRLHRELHPTKVYQVASFADTPEQAFPSSARAWELLGGPRPTHIYLFDGPFSDTSVQNEVYPSPHPLTLLGDATLGEVFAGVRVGSSYAAKACMGQVGEASGAQGAQMQTAAAFSCDGATPWILAIPFRMHATDTSAPLAGSYDGTRGWRVEWNDSGGAGLKLIVRGDTTVTGTLSGRNYMDGCPHVVFVKYVPGSNQITFWTEAEALASPLTVPANSHNQVGVVLGALPSAAGVDTADTQVPYTVGWSGALGADDFDDSDPLTAAWWTHGTDPTGLISAYSVSESMYGVVQSDADGVIMGAYPKSSVPIFEYAANKRGASWHAASVNRWRNPYWFTWGSQGAPTETMRYGEDASRMKRSIHITGDGAGVDYRYFSVTPGAAGYVTVVVVARRPAGAPAGSDGRIILADSSGVVKDSATITLTALWQRFEAVLAWDNATANARVGFGLDQDGDEMELHPVGGVYYTAGSAGYAPYGLPLSPLASTTTPAAHGLSLDQTLSLNFNKEGEIHVIGACDEAAPASRKILEVHGGGDEEKRALAVDASSDLAGSMFAEDGSETSASAAGPADWRDEWNARLRWNYGGLMNDTGLGAQVHSDSADATVWTFGAFDPNVGARTLNQVDVGHSSGSLVLSGLVARVMLSSRERPK